MYEYTKKVYICDQTPRHFNLLSMYPDAGNAVWTAPLIAPLISDVTCPLPLPAHPPRTPA